MKKSHVAGVSSALALLISVQLFAFKIPIHLEITKTVLSAISKTVGNQTYQFTDKAVQEIMKANQGVDECITCQTHSEYHFDDENFAGGSQRLVDLKKQILTDLSGASPNGAKARKHLGQALHTLQDFYAHSTRVESGLSKFDDLLGVKAFSGLDLAAKTCPGDPAVLGPVGRTNITSGYFPLPSPCNGSIPDGKCRHGNDVSLHGLLDTCDGINKDAPGRPNYQAAHDLAVKATDRYVTELILNDPSITNNAKAVKALMGISNDLGMVVDTTGSMGAIVDTVRSNIDSIVHSVVGTPDEPDQYLLEPFNDPFWGPTTATSDAGTFLTRIDSLSTSGGGDCPELAMHGLLEAVNAADDQSTLYLFTDASAKDSSLFTSVNAMALKKKVTINYVTFGSCSPIDPGFQATAAATGGQVFVLNRFTERGSIFSLISSQIGPPEVTIAHSAGTLSSSRDVPFPVDSSLTLLTVSSSMDVSGAITLTRPDGTTVAASDPGVTITNLSTGRVFIINSPQTGNWNLNIQGSGSYSVDVQGKTTRDLLRQLPKFGSFDFVTLTGRIAHEGYFPIAGQPVVGDPQTVVARVGGITSNVAFSLITEAGDPLRSLTLSQGDPNAISDDFVGPVSLPAQPFRVLATGEDAKGTPFQRTYSVLFRPETVKVTPDTFLLDGLPKGQNVSLVYQVQNAGSSDSFRVSASDGKAFVTSVTPPLFTLESGGVTKVTVNLFVPQSATIGTEDSITVVATSRTRPDITNSAVQTVEVASADTTPPAITVVANSSTLWPPNGKMVPVVISGTISDAQSGVNLSSGKFLVIDEYGSVQPSGSFVINSDGTYSFTVLLEASRLGTDQDGRKYTISVQARDNAGNLGSASTDVIVPHDQGR